MFFIMFLFKARQLHVFRCVVHGANKLIIFVLKLGDNTAQIL